MKIAADLNNMNWRIRPEEILLEVNRPYTSRLALQKPCEVLLKIFTRGNGFIK